MITLGKSVLSTLNYLLPHFHLPRKKKKKGSPDFLIHPFPRECGNGSFLWPGPASFHCLFHWQAPYFQASCKEQVKVCLISPPERACAPTHCPKGLSYPCNVTARYQHTLLHILFVSQVPEMGLRLLCFILTKGSLSLAIPIHFLTNLTSVSSLICKLSPPSLVTSSSKTTTPSWQVLVFLFFFHPLETLKGSLSYYYLTSDAEVCICHMLRCW